MQRLARSLAVAAALIATTGSGSMAQDAGTKPPAQPAKVKEPGPAAEATASIDFKGGTLSEYIGAIDTAFGGSNIVVTPGLESQSVGPVKLVNVRREEAALAIEVLARAPSGMGIGVSPIGDPPIFRVITNRRPGPPAPEKRVSVWTLAPVLDDKTSAEQVLSAVETALALVPGPADVKYHKDTRLLIISGTDEHARAIHQVIGSLEEARRRTEAQAGEPSVPKAQALEEENHRLRERIAELERRLRSMNDEESKPAR